MLLNKKSNLGARAQGVGLDTAKTESKKICDELKTVILKTFVSAYHAFLPMSQGLLVSLGIARARMETRPKKIITYD